ncbi:MAG: MetQ/NlpA family ABC transporter substrate-binding protein [Treponema sp.]|nr:MetQ/NlpA family ABC transporter substrate-binding protein [Treponema sp.]
MKKLAFAAIVGAALCVGCSRQSGRHTLTVGATPEPHAAMLNVIADELAAEGITLKVVEFTDYVTPNDAVESGELDANFFQHEPFMNSCNAERGYHLVNVGGIHIEPLALYSQKYTDFSAIPDGATIAIPNDPTNEGRALLLLQAHGVITLADSAHLESIPADIVENPKNFRFREIEAPSLPLVLADVDAAVINGNYALAAGFSAQDGLLVEGAASPYVNVVAVHAQRADDARIAALVAALKSQKVKDYLEHTYPNGEVVAVF